MKAYALEEVPTGLSQQEAEKRVKAWVKETGKRVVRRVRLKDGSVRLVIRTS